MSLFTHSFYKHKRPYIIIRIIYGYSTLVCGTGYDNLKCLSIVFIHANYLSTGSIGIMYINNISNINAKTITQVLLRTYHMYMYTYVSMYVRTYVLHTYVQYITHPITAANFIDCIHT